MEASLPRPNTLRQAYPGEASVRELLERAVEVIDVLEGVRYETDQTQQSTILAVSAFSNSLSRAARRRKEQKLRDSVMELDFSTTLECQIGGEEVGKMRSLWCRWVKG